jgi:regulator of RNase E activity RraA
MTAGAQARLVLGVVISGRCRDVPQFRSKQFPVFARATSTLGQNTFTSPSQVNIPLLITPPGQAHATTEQNEEFPSVEVQPGDWIVADESGVVCVPHELESKVVELAEEEKRIDELRMLDIEAGLTLGRALETHRAKRLS